MAGGAVANVAKSSLKDSLEDLGAVIFRRMAQSTEGTISATPLAKDLAEYVTKTGFHELSVDTQREIANHTAYLESTKAKGLLNNTTHPLQNGIALRRFGKNIQDLNPKQLNAIGSEVGTRTARENWSATTFGPKHVLLKAATEDVAKNLGPAAAQSYREAWQVLLHETSEARQGPLSKDWSHIDGLADKDSPYRQHSKLETRINAAMSVVMTPFIAIPHFFQGGNDFIATNLASMARGLGDSLSNPQEALTWARRIGVLEAETRYLTERAANGLDTWPMKLIHQPGFSQMRRLQIIWSAATHKNNILGLAEDYARNSSRADLEVNLRWYGLDPTKIRANVARGLPALEDSDLMRATYNGVDATMMINRDVKTPYGWNTSVWTRNLFKYKHWSYAEQKFVKDMLQQGYREQGLYGIGKKLAIIGTVFVGAGELIKAAQHAVRGQGFNQQDYQKFNLINPHTLENAGVPHGTAEGISEYIDAMSHTVGIGIEMGALSAAKQGTLSHIIAGPVPSVGIDVTQDIIRGDWKHLERYAVGKAGPMGPWLANNFMVPTPEEERLQKRKSAIVKKQTRAYNNQHKDTNVFDSIEGK